MRENYHRPKGTYDLLPYGQLEKERWRNISLWHKVEEEIRQLTRKYCLEEIRTPLFERTELFQRSSGEASDVVIKEMYNFLDRGDRALSLRPEMTASVVRLMQEEQLFHLLPLHRLFYLGPMFRYARPQSGRYRQFSQFGVEILGTRCIEDEAELLQMIYALLHSLGLGESCCFLVNSLGEERGRKAYTEELVKYLQNYQKDLSEESRRRLQLNPLRILDSKNPQDQQLLKEAPQIDSFFSSEENEHFHSLLTLLRQLSIPHRIEPRLVRGLDYYNGLVFEVVSSKQGAQSSLGGGGRYDALFQKLGGKAHYGMGFSLGMERLIQALVEIDSSLAPLTSMPRTLLVPLDREGRAESLSLLGQLRLKGISCFSFYGAEKKMERALRFADRQKIRWVLFLGEQERERGEVQVKEMYSGKQFFTTREALPALLTRNEKRA